MPWFRNFKRTTTKRMNKRGLGKMHVHLRRTKVRRDAVEVESQHHKNRKKGVKKNKSVKKDAGK